MDKINTPDIESKLKEEIDESTVLVVEDNDVDFSVVDRALTDYCKIERCHSTEEAIKKVFNIEPHIIIIDYHLPNKNGIELCTELRDYNRFESTPILMVTGDEHATLELDFWNAGCSDFVKKPFNPTTLIKRVEHHLKYQKMLDRYRNEAMIDSLTKVFNRRYLESVTKQLYARLESPQVSALMVDVDWFKRYNDTYGHLAGDSVLVRVADALTKSLERSTDFVTRLGGEEFAIVLPNTDDVGANVIANRVIKSVESLNIAHNESPFEKVTVSVGGVTHQHPPKDWQALVDEADSNLYLAKGNGRNQFVCSSSI